MDGFPLQAGAITNGISDWVNAKGYKFNGVTVDYNIPVQGGLVEEKALRSRSRERVEGLPGNVGFGLTVSVKMFPLS